MALERQIWTIILAILSAHITGIDSVRQCYRCLADRESPCSHSVQIGDYGMREYDCNTKYCTIERVESKVDDVIIKFYRNCDNYGTRGFKEDEHYRYYYQSCTEELCNVGDGTSPSFSDEARSELHHSAGKNASEKTVKNLKTLFVFTLMASYVVNTFLIL